MPLLKVVEVAVGGVALVHPGEREEEEVVVIHMVATITRGVAEEGEGDMPPLQEDRMVGGSTGVVEEEEEVVDMGTCLLNKEGMVTATRAIR